MKKIQLLVILLLAVAGGINRAAAQGTAFTYQGVLTDTGGPLNGFYDLTFTLYDSAGPGGNLVGSPNPNARANVPVSGGLVTTTLDYGSSAFTGGPRWLEITVHLHSGGPTTTLTPRQQLTPAPYAITAGSSTGPVADAQLSGNIPRLNGNFTVTGTANFNPASGAPFAVGSNTKINNLNADLLDGLDSTAFWKLVGNGGTTPGINFLGTTDNQALELKVNSSRALRLEPKPSDAPNFIAGASVNVVSTGTVGAAVGGGGAAGYPELLPPLGGFVNVGANQIGSDFSAIGGGGNNTISNNSIFAVIGGGALNTIQTNSLGAAIGGGLFNIVQTNALFATVGGGVFNQAAGPGAFVGGGGFASSIPGTFGNFAGGTSSAIVGGLGNFIPTYDNFSAIGGGLWNIIGNDSTGGGPVYSFNTIGATIGGGVANTNQGFCSTIPGGYQNVALGYYSFAAGQNAKSLHDGTFVWADDSSPTPFSSTTSNQFLVRASFAGINRATRITGNEYFGLRAPVTNTYGGMYVETAGTGLPFYGYAMAGGAYAWTYLDGNDGNKWKLWVNGIQVTVTPSGNVGIGTTTPGYRLEVNGSVAGVGAYHDISDARYKTNVVTLTHALETVSALRGVRFEWREKDYPAMNFESGPQLGFIAQELKQVLPEAVSVDKQGVHTVAYSKVIPVLVEAIKELRQAAEHQQGQLTDRDAKITDLQNENVALRKEMAALKSAQGQANAQWEDRLIKLEKAMAGLADQSGTTLAVNHQLAREK
jgi:hypothetical protein